MDIDSEFTPNFLYKYKQISNTKNPHDDYSIKALFESYAVISTRNLFNDLFDSQIKLIKPLKNEIRLLIKEKGLTTDSCRNWLDESICEINEILDNYYIYCLSSKCRSNLMWAHYADNHKGFCIEFKFEGMMAKKISYEKEIPQIKLIDYLISDYSRKFLANEIGHALLVKLDEWKYEAEYRLITSSFDMPVAHNKLQSLKYNPLSVESIIFGNKMDNEMRNFIINNLPFETKFKEVIKLESSLDIREYKPPEKQMRSVISP
jgi:Protein of unknown function (DUF2971)